MICTIAYKDKHCLRVEENFHSSASLNAAVQRCWFGFTFARLQLYHCLLSNNQMTNLQERKITSKHRWEGPLGENFSFLENYQIWGK